MFPSHQFIFRANLLIACLLVVKTCHSQETLREFAPDGFYVGGVLHGDSEGFQSFEYRNVAKQEFNAITASIYMGWGSWPDPDQPPKVKRLTDVIDWGVQNGQKIHAHSLIYPLSNQSLDWFNRLPNPDVPRTIEKYIDSVAGARAGKVWLWDVVNEVMADPGQKMDEDGLRTDYKEYQAMRSHYVDLAFRRAKLIDPNALLILNDYGIGEWNEKSTRLFNFARKLKARGVPIDGIGFQMHFTNLNQARPNVSSITRNFHRFANAGFQLFITEMDVCSIATKHPHPNSPGVSTPSAQQLKRQANFFTEVTQVALNQPKCKALLLWDYADDFSWLHKTDRQIGNLTPGTFTHPAPFWCGKHCPISKKPAYYSILNALKKAPKIAR